MRMTADQIATATQYLRPMQTSTLLVTCQGRDADDGDRIQLLADELAERFPDAVHVGFGGRVSRGRLADSLPDEVIDPEVAQTIIVEAYEGYRGMEEFAKVIFAMKPHLHPETAITILWPDSTPVPSWMSNRTVSGQYVHTMEEEKVLV